MLHTRSAVSGKDAAVRKSAAEAPSLAPPRFVGRPTLQEVVCQPCTASQFSEPEYLRLATEIFQAPKFHRKQWEYIYMLRAMEQLNLLREGVSALGFGCGKEPLAAVMAKNDMDVTVTDIPPFQGSDSHWGSSCAMDLFYAGICSEEHFTRQVKFRNVNMNEIPDDLGKFDMVWSCCALEHLGSLRHGLDFILNSAKCLKPGGIGIHTTELNVSDDVKTLESPGLSLYRRKDILELQNDLAAIGCSMLPLNFHTGDLPQDKYVDLPPYQQDVHLKLQVDSYTLTSYGIVLRKS
jgi:2-polyprenyl-3-methyl-5-hydroxy-6-metoxy-1,4-benzoquinol methylase